MSTPDWIIGDVHGRREVIDAAKKLNGIVLFLGDFLDSFYRSPQDQVYCLQTAIAMAKTGKWQFIIGNHECSYLYRDMRCSGWNIATETHIVVELGTSAIQKAGLSFLYDKNTNTLFTHAGLTRNLHGLLKQCFGALDLETALQEWFTDHDSPFYQVGRWRGGSYPVGGPLWCDIREFDPVPNLRQVFGHTQMPPNCGIWYTPDKMNWEIDCLATCAEILHYNRETDEFEIARLDIVIGDHFGSKQKGS